jgi:hypothetical protein
MMSAAVRTGHSSEGVRRRGPGRVSDRRRTLMRQVITNALFVLSFGFVIVGAGLKW